MRILVSVLLLITVASGVQAEQVGDMNTDGQIDTVESIISLRVAAGLEPGVPLGSYTPATGNAVAADVLKGKTFSNSSGASTGTIKNNGSGSTINPGTTNQTGGGRLLVFS